MTIYSEELAKAVCEEIANGKSLRQIEKIEGMPSRDSIRRWCCQKDEFQVHYAQAKKKYAESIVDELVDIADDGVNDFMDEAAKKSGREFNSEHVQRSRLCIDTRKWIASKLLPKVYGDSLNVTGETKKRSRLLI